MEGPWLCVSQLVSKFCETGYVARREQQTKAPAINETRTVVILGHVELYHMFWYKTASNCFRYSMTSMSSFLKRHCVLWLLGNIWINTSRVTGLVGRVPSNGPYMVTSRIYETHWESEFVKLSLLYSIWLFFHIKDITQNSHVKFSIGVPTYIKGGPFKILDFSLIGHLYFSLIMINNDSFFYLNIFYNKNESIIF